MTETPTAPSSSGQPGEMVIAAEGLGKTYGHVVALRDASLSLRRGEVVALFGDNGAGKSTLTKCLCGVIEPDEGQLRVLGHEARFRSIRDAEAVGIATVHQDLALAPDLSVLESIFLGHEIVGSGWRRTFGVLSRRRMAERAREAVAALSINLPSVEVAVGDLSGGQKQAVAIARATMWSSAGILMDEPTAALGPRQSEVVCDLIRQTAENGLGVLVISHDIPRVLSIADRVVILRQGTVALEAKADGLTRHEIVEAMVGYTGDGND